MKSEERIRLLSADLREQVIEMMKTETGTELTWPVYVSIVDLLKDVMCAVFGYASWTDADSIIDEFHDLAADTAGRILKIREP